MFTLKKNSFQLLFLAIGLFLFSNLGFTQTEYLIQTSIESKTFELNYTSSYANTLKTTSGDGERLYAAWTTTTNSSPIKMVSENGKTYLRMKAKGKTYELSYTSIGKGKLGYNRVYAVWTKNTGKFPVTKSNNNFYATIEGKSYELNWATYFINNQKDTQFGRKAVVWHPNAGTFKLSVLEYLAPDEPVANIKNYKNYPQLGKTTNPKDEGGFRVSLKGVQCLQTGDAANNVDELYIEVYADEKHIQTIGPRPMNEGASNDWEKFWEATVVKETNDNIASWFGMAKKEFWLHPCDVYANSIIRFEFWEDDAGGKEDSPFMDDDDLIGMSIFTMGSPENNHYIQEFNGEHGHWKMAFNIEKGRKDYDASINSSKSIAVRVPTQNQGNYGACGAYSVVGALTTSYLNKTKSGTSREELFDALAFYGRRDKTKYPDEQDGDDTWDDLMEGLGLQDPGEGDGGWTLEEALNQLLLVGIPFKNSTKTLKLKNYYKYTKSGKVVNHYVRNGQVMSEVLEYGLNNSNDGLNKMRKVIQNGEPLIASYYVYPDFGFYAGEYGVYGGNIVDKDKPGGHAIFIVGFTNPSPKSHLAPTWIIQNSWGTNFGDNGKCRFVIGACGIDDHMFQFGNYEVIE